MGKTTKIDWVDATYSPVTGCDHGCQYCYARRIASRFSGFDENDELNQMSYAMSERNGKIIYEVDRLMTRVTKSGEKQAAPYPFGFAPTLHNYKLIRDLKTLVDPRDIFVCSMSDLFADCIPDGWIQRVFQACMQFPKHRYFFLTKNPERYVDLFNSGILPQRQDNFWLGTTVINPYQPYFYKVDANCFLSIEPIQADFRPDDTTLRHIQWVIVGAETGNRVGKVKPEKEWIMNISEVCKKIGIPLFMKESLRSLMGDDFRQEKP